MHRNFKKLTTCNFRGDPLKSHLLKEICKSNMFLLCWYQLSESEFLKSEKTSSPAPSHHV